MQPLALALIALGLLQPFRPAEPYGPGHRGIDLSAPAFASTPLAGTLTFAGRVGSTPTVTITRGEVKLTLQPVVAFSPVGTTVRAGQVVGRVVSAPGYHCTQCLHLGLRMGGQYRDPLTFFGSRLQPLGSAIRIE